MPLPVKNQQYEFEPIILFDIDDPSIFVTDPDIVAGDFKFSLDGSDYEDLDITPAVSPAGSKSLVITAIDTEMNGSKLSIIGSDQSADEWRDVLITLDIPVINTETLPVEIWDEIL
jgi:hypothetical protein